MYVCMCVIECIAMICYKLDEAHEMISKRPMLSREVRQALIVSFHKCYCSISFNLL